MRHASLFSGIGGFDLAAEWMGWENVLHCEINPFCRQILSYYWPNAKSYEDIKRTDFSIHRGTINILTGGFPCQPYSTAGKRLGKDDDRHLWPEMLRAIREIQPTWVVGENVRGLVNWNGGLVFDEVQADLEALGYEITPFILPACAVNAPHRRDRVWFVANCPNSGPESVQQSRENGVFESEIIADTKSIENIRRGQEGFYAEPSGVDAKGDATNSTMPNKQWNRICSSGSQTQIGRCDCESNDTDTSGAGWEQFNIPDLAARSGYSSRLGNEKTTNWEDFPTQPPVCCGNDGLPSELDGITFPKWRNESIKGYGNAVVPQVVLQIFKAIEQYSNL